MSHVGNGKGGNGSGYDDDALRSRFTIHELASRLKGKVGHYEGREVVRCPGPDHSAGDASLVVGFDDDASGGFWVHSFSAKDNDPIRLKDWVRAKAGAPGFKPNGKGNGHANPRDEITARYIYADLDGAPVLAVNRTKAKKFLQQHPTGDGGWEWGGIPEGRKVPYHADELVEAIALGKRVYVVEGEKAADRMRAAGLTATCSPGGACKWPDHFAEWFAGSDVTILPDADEPGRKHAAKVRANLEGAAASVRVIHLPGLIPGGDVWDYLAAGGDPDAIANMREGPPPRGHMAAELWGMMFPAIKYAVPLYIAEGLTLLAGAPKRGKSWLALDLCCAVAWGGFTLGDKHCTEGDVLYCALEDSPRRMKSRLHTLCDAAGRAPPRLTVWFGSDLPRLGQGCEEALREWLTSHPDPRLIVIDTLNYIRPERTRDEDPYSYDYRSATTLQRLASEFAVAIVLIHHTRKTAADDYLESISGTNGLTGGSDAVIVLERQGDGSTVFKGRGRDIEEFELAVRFDKDECRWRVLGDPTETRQSDTRSKILDHMREAGWFMTPAEIAANTGLRPNVVSQQLFQMVKAGQVRRAGRGKYGLPEVEVEGGKVVPLRPEEPPE